MTQASEREAQALRMIPMLSYEDVAGAVAWLTAVFGFQERSRITAADGTISHVELAYEGNTLFLGNPGSGYESPRHHREHCTAARRWSGSPYVVDGLYVEVVDVDAHLERARRGGAVILSGPETNPIGLRLYRAEDVEGHRWMFAQRLGSQDQPASESPSAWGVASSASKRQGSQDQPASDSASG